MSGYFIAREEHEDGTPHLHILIRFIEKINYKDPACFDFLTGKHGNYQSVRSFKNVLAYLNKEDSTPLQWGDIVNDKTWLDIARSANEAEVWNQLTEYRPRDAMMSGDRIVANWRKRKRALKPPVPPTDPDLEENKVSNIDLIWFWGNAGSGKDRRVRKMAFAAQKTLFIKKSDTEKWWDEYNGEESICFEDLRGSDMKFHNFLQLTNPYRDIDYQVPIKGGFKTLKAHTIFITTGYHPKNLWKNTKKAVEWGMLKRRLTKVYHTFEYTEETKEDWNVGMVDETEFEDPVDVVPDPTSFTYVS